MNNIEINKKNSDLLVKVEHANGRKEILGLIKKVAKLKSKILINN